MPSFQFDLETAREMYRAILNQELFGNGSFVYHPFKSNKTVIEKVKELWERSNYYHMLEKKEEELRQAMLASKKQKPYYRRHERW